MSVTNGYLTLRAVKSNDSMLIRAIGSQDRFMTTYGYFECRAQLQQSQVNGAPSGATPRLSEGDDPAIYGAK